jgi:hypothetical protein
VGIRPFASSRAAAGHEISGKAAAFARWRQAAIRQQASPVKFEAAGLEPDVVICACGAEMPGADRKFPRVLLGLRTGQDVAIQRAIA